jgi:protein unc-45
MPAEEDLLGQAEKWKTKGNAAFGSSDWETAISAYSQGMVLLDRMVVMSTTIGAVTVKATILSNRAMCHLKQATSLEQLQWCIDDCTTALQVLDHQSSAGGSTTASLRAKILFKRAKARVLQANWPTTTTVVSNSNSMEQHDKLQEAAKDILSLLSFDPHNKDANKLLQTIRAQHSMAQKSNAQATTPLGKTLWSMQQLDDKTLHHTKVLLGMLTNDPVSATMELGRLKGVPVLLDTLQSNDWSVVPRRGTHQDASVVEDEAVEKTDKVRGLALQALACAASHPPFCRTFLNAASIQEQLSKIIVDCCRTTMMTEVQEDRAISALAVYLRLILHLDRDVEPDGTVASTTLVQDKPLLQAILAALATRNMKLTRATVDVVSSWTAGRDRESVIVASLDIVTAKNDLPRVATQDELRQMAPREMSSYKQRRYAKLQRDEQWAYDRSITFCTHPTMEEVVVEKEDGTLSSSSSSSSSSTGLKSLLNCIVDTEDANVRHELVVSLAKLLASQIRKKTEEDDIEALEEFIGNYLGFKGKVKKKNDEKKEEKKEDLGVVIEELGDDDEEVGKIVSVSDDGDEVKKDDDHNDPVTFRTLLQRTALASALLLANNEAGAWAIGQGWPTCRDNLAALVASEHKLALCLVAECLTAAATLNETRSYAATMLSSDQLKSLVGHADRDIRTAAATAVTKIGLAEKGTDDVEMMGLLEAACFMLQDVLEDEHEAENNGMTKKTTTSEAEKKKKQQDKLKGAKLPAAAAKAPTSVERGVETVLYLVSKTFIKEEIAAGFGLTNESKYSGLELLVKVADLPSAGESLSAFALASIFQHMSVTQMTLRQELFEGKEMTMEQYDEVQKMQKTEEEKDMMDQEDEEYKDDKDENCAERVRKMVKSNVPRALVQLTEGASEKTLEQIILALSRMASVTSVRGSMIQQGVLSTLIKVDKEEKVPSETKKKILRMGRHTMGKLLISTNPALLTSAQRMGSIKPLIHLVRDIQANGLQHFECLMALTNLASGGDDLKNKIVAEKGIATLHYAMFNDHEMVQQAATEVMANLIPHEKMLEHLKEHDVIRLWLALSSDHEEKYETARAACGGLAMATQDPAVAKAMIGLPNFKERVDSILESGHLEMMHRMFVIILNLAELGGEFTMAVYEHGLYQFALAYVSSFHAGAKASELDFADKESGLFNVIVDMAKQIVKACDDTKAPLAQ